MSRDRNYLDAKRREILEKIADAILNGKSSHKKLEQILDTTLQFQRLRAQGLDVKVCDGGLILIPGRAEGKSQGLAQSASRKGAAQRALKTYIKCVGMLVAGLAGCFLLADYSDIDPVVSAAQLPPAYVEEIYCRATQGCED